MEKVQHVEQFGVKKGYSVKQTLKFLVPSLIGVLLFLVPLSVDGTVTIGLGVMADALQAAVADYIPLIYYGSCCLVCPGYSMDKKRSNQCGEKQFFFDRSLGCYANLVGTSVFSEQFLPFSP